MPYPEEMVTPMRKELTSIGVEDSAREIFGKTMSIPDDLMWDWYLLLTDIDEDEGTVEIDLTVTNDAGETRVFGTAVLSLPA